MRYVVKPVYNNRIPNQNRDFTQRAPPKLSHFSGILEVSKTRANVGCAKDGPKEANDGQHPMRAARQEYRHGGDHDRIPPQPSIRS